MSAALQPRLPVAVVYGAALAAGLSVVSFPASGTVLKATYGLTDEGYGAIFLPQTLLTIVGSLAGAALAPRLGLRRLLLLTLLGFGAAAACLGSALWVPSDQLLVVLMAGTAFMGLGFGLGAAPLNAYPGLLFPGREETFLVVLHTVLASGFALGPALVAGLVDADLWVAFPAALLALSLLIASLVPGAALPTDDEPQAADAGAGARAVTPRWLALFAVIAVLYAFAEGTFANWAAIYLHEARDVPQSTAAFAISAFWGALAVGRLVSSALVSRFGAERVWLALPPVMVVALWLLPMATDATSGILLFGLAGFGASAFFPLTVAIASRVYAGKTALVSSVLTAALMLGVGGGSFVLGAMRSLPFGVLYRASSIYPAAAFVLALGLLRALRARQTTP